MTSINISPLIGFKHPDSYSRIAQARFQMLNNRVAAEYL